MGYTPRGSKESPRLSDFTIKGDRTMSLMSPAMYYSSFFLGRKAMTNLDSILKSGDTTLPTMVRLVKAMVFPVVMYGMDV